MQSVEGDDLRKLPWTFCVVFTLCSVFPVIVMARRQTILSFINTYVSAKKDPAPASNRLL